jgi:hypothetical protein
LINQIHGLLSHHEKSWHKSKIQSESHPIIPNAQRKLIK